MACSAWGGSGLQNRLGRVRLPHRPLSHSSTCRPGVGGPRACLKHRRTRFDSGGRHSQHAVWDHGSRGERSACTRDVRVRIPVVPLPASVAQLDESARLRTVRPQVRALPEASVTRFRSSEDSEQARPKRTVAGSSPAGSTSNAFHAEWDRLSYQASSVFSGACRPGGRPPGWKPGEPLGARGSTPPCSVISGSWTGDGARPRC